MKRKLALATVVSATLSGIGTPVVMAQEAVAENPPVVADTPTSDAEGSNPVETVSYSISYPTTNNTVQKGGSLIISAPEGAPAGSRFERILDTPAWVNVGTDGTLTVSAFGVNPGRYDVKVKVVLPNQTSQVISTFVSVTQAPMNLQYDLKYQDGTQLQQGASTTVAAPAGTPVGTGFTREVSTPYWVVVDPSGNLSVAPGYDAKPGKYSFTVLATFSDTTRSHVPVTIDVLDAPVSQASYGDPRTITQGEVTVIPAPSNAPAGTKYSATPQTPSWVTVQGDGSLRVSPLDTTVAKTYNVPVIARFPGDGGQVVTSATVVVNSAWHSVPYYPDGLRVSQTGSLKVAKPANFPDRGTASSTVTTPTWVRVAADGSMVLTPGADIAVGSYKVPVQFQNGNGDRQVIEVPVQVDPLVVSYGDAPFNAYGGRTLKVAKPSNVPAGATITLDDGTPDWVSVDQEGAITLSPKESDPSRYYTFRVLYNLDSGFATAVTLNVRLYQTPTFDGAYTVQAGGEGLVTNSWLELSPDAQVKSTNETPEWVQVFSDGRLSINPGAEVAEGDYKVPVIAQYKDGTEIQRVADVHVDAAKQELSMPKRIGIALGIGALAALIPYAILTGVNADLAGMPNELWAGILGILAAVGGFFLVK